jgi:hypothetical protein
MSTTHSIADAQHLFKRRVSQSAAGELNTFLIFTLRNSAFQKGEASRGPISIAVGT